LVTADKLSLHPGLAGLGSSINARYGCARAALTFEGIGDASRQAARSSAILDARCAGGGLARDMNRAHKNHSASGGYRVREDTNSTAANLQAVSDGLIGEDPVSMSPEEVPITQEPRPWSAGNGRAWVRPAHLVHFYEDDEALAAAAGKFVSSGLLAAELVTIIATREHLEAVGRHLRAEGIDLDAVRASDRLLFMDAHETLAAIMRDGAPDRGLFESVIGDVMGRRSAAANGVGQRAYGEMVDILWKRGEKRAALHLEELWNGLQVRQPFTLLCAYAMGKFYKEPATIVRAASVTPDPTEVAAREILHREEMELALRESLRELRAKEEELHRSEEQLRDFFENGTVALQRVDADGRILWANRAELDLLGYTADEYIGRPISDFHADQVLIADILTRLVRGEALHDVEAQLRAKDGATKHVLISSSGYFRDGEFVHSRCFTRDITERRNAEQAVRDS
jgi:PAS domain S-box-containing protein